MIKLTDEMLSKAIKEIVEEEEKKFEAREPVKYTNRFEKKMKRLCHKVENPYRYMLNKGLKMAGCFFLVGLLSSTVLVLKVDAFRLKFFEIIDWISDTYGIKKFQVSETIESEMKEPAYVPKGFEKVSEGVTENSAIYGYTDGTDKLRVNLTLIKKDMKLYYDIEYTSTEKVNLKYGAGDLFKKDGKYIKLIFYRDSLQYEIHIDNSKFDTNEIIRIANSF